MAGTVVIRLTSRIFGTLTVRQRHEPVFFVLLRAAPGAMSAQPSTVVEVGSQTSSDSSMNSTTVASNSPDSVNVPRR